MPFTVPPGIHLCAWRHRGVLKSGKAGLLTLSLSYECFAVLGSLCFTIKLKCHVLQKYFRDFYWDNIEYVDRFKKN